MLIARGFLILLAVSSSYRYCNAQAWEWLKPAQSARNVSSLCLVSGGDSLLCVTGICDTAFQYNGQFIGNTIHNVDTSYAWLMLVKTNGDVILEKSVVAERDISLNRAVFANNLVYLAGCFNGNYAIIGSDTIYSSFPSSTTKVFAAVMDLNGNFISKRILFSGKNVSVSDIVVTNSLYISGTCLGPASFIDTSYSFTNYRAYYIKTDTALNYIWYNTFENCPDIGAKNLIEVSPQGDTLYCAIQYKDSVKIGSFQFSSGGYSVVTFACNNTMSNFYWAENVNSVNTTLFDIMSNNNKIYVAGYVRTNAGFGSGYTITPSFRAFLAIYSGQSGLIQNLIGSQTNRTYAVALARDKSSNVYLALHSDTNFVVFNYDTINLPLQGDNIKLFVYKLSYDSIVRYRRLIYGDTDAFSGYSYSGLSVDFSGNAYLTANYSCNIATDTVAFNLSGTKDALFGKISCVQKAPEINLSTQFFCPGDSLLLQVNSDIFNDVIWSTGDTIPYIYITVPDTYSVVLNDENMCSSPATDVFTYNYQLPAITLDNNCDTLSIIPPAGSTFTWLLNGDTIAENVDSIVTDLAGYYYLYLIDSNGCYINDSIYHYSKATLSLSRACDTLYASVIPAYDYFWVHTTDTLGLSLASIYASETGSYKASFTDSNGCYIIDSIYHYSKATLSLSRACDTLYASVVPAYDYYWVHTTDTLGLSSASIFATETGSYQASFTDSNGCYIVDSIYHYSKATLNLSRACDTLYASVVPAYDYYWVHITDTLGLSLASIFASETGNYHVSFTDSNGCYVTDSIYHYSKATLSLSRVCDTLFAFVTPGYNYYWISESDTINENTQQIIPPYNGEFIVSLADSNNCYLSDSYEFTATGKELIIKKDCENLIVINNNDNVNWYFNGSYAATSASYDIGENLNEGNYYAVYIDSASCYLASNIIYAGFSESRKNIKFYPNPSQGLLFIETGINNTLHITISSAGGAKGDFTQYSETVEIEGSDGCGKFTGRKYTIDTSRLPVGIYVINFFTNELSWSRKFVKM